MKPLVVSIPGEMELAAALAQAIDGDLAKMEIRSFPDGETYIRIDSPVEDREVVVACSLFEPNEKVLPLLFVAETVRDLNASRVGLAAPYLAYMRQDARFRPGEGVTSRYFGRLLSGAFDWLVTVEPHLHRHSGLDDIYTIPTVLVEAAKPIARWIDANVDTPLLVGPDEESEQWVSAVAAVGDFPTAILDKVRRGDFDVDVSGRVRNTELQPVLLDDIISTGRTMLEAVRHLTDLGFVAPVCIGIHGLFVKDALVHLKEANVTEVVTCNTVRHHTNGIEIREEVAGAVSEIIRPSTAELGVVEH